jgi:antitoxin component of MazEF toxin-antitoxin module
MRVKLVRVGNSRSIRIPNELIKLLGLGEVVDVNANQEGIVIAAHREPRHGWKHSFAKASPAENEILLDRLPPNALDGEEWTWLQSVRSGHWNSELETRN